MRLSARCQRCGKHSALRNQYTEGKEMLMECSLRLKALRQLRSSTPVLGQMYVYSTLISHSYLQIRSMSGTGYPT